MEKVIKSFQVQKVENERDYKEKINFYESSMYREK